MKTLIHRMGWMRLMGAMGAMAWLGLCAFTLFGQGINTRPGTGTGGGGTNSTLAVAVNGTVISGVATQVNLVGGTNTVLTPTNSSGKVSIGVHSSGGGGSSAGLTNKVNNLNGAATNLSMWGTLLGDPTFDGTVTLDNVVILSGETRLPTAAPSKLLRVDSAGIVTDAVVGNGLSFDGATVVLAGSATNGLNNGKADKLNGSVTNLTAYAGAKPGATIVPAPGSATNRWQVLDTNGVPSLYQDSNNVLTASSASIGAGSGLAAVTRWYSTNGSNYVEHNGGQNILTNSVILEETNATAGVRVLQPAGIGTNQAHAVALLPGQVVTFSGTAYVASNFPGLDGFAALTLPGAGPVLYGGDWIINEQFLGDCVGQAAGTLGSGPWKTQNSGTVPVPIAAIIGDPNWTGYLTQMTTQTTSGASAYMGVTSGGTNMCMTNGAGWVIARIRIGLTNSSGDVSTMRVGLGRVNHAAEMNTGAVIMSNTNVNTNTLVCVTAINGTSTFTYTSYVWTPMKWFNVGIYFDTTGTNAVFYAGTNASSMTAIATNITNLPGTASVNPWINTWRIAASSGLTPMTNYCDYYKMWARSDAP